eukprot:1651764-Prymnesium_polylepis.1
MSVLLTCGGTTAGRTRDQALKRTAHESDGTGPCAGRTQRCTHAAERARAEPHPSGIAPASAHSIDPFCAVCTPPTQPPA